MPTTRQLCAANAADRRRCQPPVTRRSFQIAGGVVSEDLVADAVIVHVRDIAGREELQTFHIDQEIVGDLRPAGHPEDGGTDIVSFQAGIIGHIDAVAAEQHIAGAAMTVKNVVAVTAGQEIVGAVADQRVVVDRAVQLVDIVQRVVAETAAAGSAGVQVDDKPVVRWRRNSWPASTPSLPPSSV